MSIEGQRPNPDSEKETLTMVAARLNQQFSQGVSAWDLVDDIRKFPKPIIVDVEETLVSAFSSTDQAANISASQAIRSLRKAGNVFIVSASGNRKWIMQQLKANHLLHPDMVVMENNRWKDHDSAQARRVIEDYIAYSNQFDRRYSQDGFQSFSKRVAPLFCKPFDIPILDDDPGVTFKNPGLLPIPIIPVTDFSVNPDAISLNEATKQVADFYTIYNNLYSRTPFKDALVTSEFQKSQYVGTKIMMLKNNPDIIVRMEKMYGSIQNEEFYQMGSALAELRDKYGLGVPRYSAVIGSPLRPGDYKCFYQVTERIHGMNLQDKVYHLEEQDIPKLKPQLEKLYTSLAQYLWDRFLNGGNYVGDLILRPEQESRYSANEQFVYGKRRDEAENHIWLVDLGPFLDVVPPHFKDIVSRFQDLSRMMEEFEVRLGTTLESPRQKVFELLRSFPASEPEYFSVLRIRRKLADPEAGTEEEDNRELTTRLSSDAKMVQELSFTKEGVVELISDFFKSHEGDFVGQLSKCGTAIYKEREQRWFEDYISDQLKTALDNKVGTEEVKALRQRYGSVFFEVIDQLIAPRKEALQKEIMPEFNKAKTEYRIKLMATLGWEEDVLSHLQDTADLVGADLVAADYYLPIAVKQLGWDYQFPYNTEAIREMFQRRRKGTKSEDDFVDFTVSFVTKHISKSLAAELKSTRAKYGRTTADILAELFLVRETEKIFNELTA